MRDALRLGYAGLLPFLAGAVPAAELEKQLVAASKRG